jgi:hypothetical protein
MPKKAIFVQVALPYWLDVAAKLRDKYSWEICYLIGRKSRERASQLFPNTVYHSKGDIRDNLFPEGCEAIKSSPLDKPLLTSLLYYESIFLKMMDRQNYNGALSYYERISAYHTQIMYWKGVLEHFKPDVVVFRIEPHVSHEYALYALCRIMDIQTVMFQRTSLPGHLYPVSSFEEGSETIRKEYFRALEMGNQPQKPLSPEIVSHLEKLSKSYDSAIPFHLRYKLSDHKNAGDAAGPVATLIRVASALYNAIRDKRAGLELDSNHIYRKYYSRMGSFKRRKLLAHYNRLAKPVDTTKPFIFVALQCEPERQTCPVGGLFGNQYLMVDLLSKLVPEGWKIYVKEHISQFKDYQTVERAKTEKFYEMIASRANVEIVPLTYNSFELIDHAKASATVSGTVGWETVVRGKPALLFGHSWYSDCKGVFITHTIEDCKKAIQKIKNGYKPDKYEVQCFARVVEKWSVRGYNDKMGTRMNIVSREENVENLARAIHEFVTST